MGDYLRYIIFGQAIIVIALSTVIIIRYAFVLSKQIKSKERVLPLHILTISTSYLILTICCLVELKLRLGEPMTWRTPTYLVAFTLGDIGLIFMLIHLSVQRILVRAILKEAAKQASEELERKHQENLAKLDTIEETVTEIKGDVKAIKKNGNGHT